MIFLMLSYLGPHFSCIRFERTYKFGGLCRSNMFSGRNVLHTFCRYLTKIAYFLSHILLVFKRSKFSLVVICKI